MHIEQKTNRIYRPIGNTTLSAEETNQVTTEIENQITAGGLTPNAGTLTQLRDSVQAVVNTSANALQAQIDAITSASDVFDVVGTYAQLQAYDTSTVPLNDIIKVLKDETRNDAMTYYRWDGSNWDYIGEEGPFYTVAETDATFAKLTDLPGIATNNQVGLVKPDGFSVTIQADGTLHVSSNVAAALPLFTSIWADHILNNSSYLRSDTFSWQSGAIYVSAYNHLVDDISGITDETETIAGTTITFKRATDGHKIVLAGQESNVSAIYTATGIAWYYILDTDNQRFKLPRTKYGFTGLRDTVGNYVPESLPNITGTVGRTFATENSGAFYTVNSTASAQGGSGGGVLNGFDASRSSSTYQDDAPVQQRATQAYLYFYIGNTIQNETSVDVAELAEDLNNKADLDLTNVDTTGTSLSAGWAMPSDTYIDLTLGASGSTYTAPANGYYVLDCPISANPGSIWAGTSGWFDGRMNTAGSIQWTSPACKKGDVTTINYVNLNTGSIAMFKFVYAEGSKSEAN